MITRYTTINKLFENFPINIIIKLKALDGIKNQNLIYQKVYK